MAEYFSFFDPVQLPDGTYDREYNAQKFTSYFKALVTTGVMKSEGNQLVVSTNGSNMITKIDTGVAFVLGRHYENDSFLELTHDTETLGKDRIDRIVVRMDLSTEARYVKAFIKKGVPSTNPVAPTLTQTANLYEISLAQVKIVGGQTFIATNAVTDERGQKVICPWAGSNILPNFNDEALDDLIDEINNIGTEVNDIKGKVPNLELTYLSPNSGWIGNSALKLYKLGKVVTVYGSVKTNTPASTWKTLVTIPSQYRVTSTLIPIDIFILGQGSQKFTTGIMQGNGSVSVEGVPVSSLATTDLLYFGFTYMLEK